MSRAFQFSIALSLFIITFLSYPTRLDDFFKAAVDFDPQFIGDLVLVSGASILAGLIAGVASAFKR